MLQTSLGVEILEQWFKGQSWRVFPFQKEAWSCYLNSQHGIINAPTGSGKTYAAFGGIVAEQFEKNVEAEGIQMIWITPLRALATEIQISISRLLEEIGLEWEVVVRNGDTKTAVRKKILTHPPQVLITTPESLHLLFCSGKQDELFSKLRSVVVDEWHDLVGSKRGVLMELALSHLKVLSPNMRIWGISATIGNIDQALEVLLGSWVKIKKCSIVRANIKKHIRIESLMPEKVEDLPWSGHLGLHLIEQIGPLLKKYRSILIFTNTRGQCEIWYQRLLLHFPDLAGIMAMHHGSIDRALRTWVESELYSGYLKVVVCTSSLDLGVDFRPVEAVVQIGSPKSISRLIQRAGRSGHQPGKVSKIYFLPTHALELVEAAAFNQAIQDGSMEDRPPYIRSFDVLIQYLNTLAVGGGFYPKDALREVRSTHCFESISKEEWTWVLNFIKNGGQGLEAYDEYQKIFEHEGKYLIKDKPMALRHMLSVGTIVGESSIKVKYLSGKTLGNVEEWFIAQLNVGDSFWFAGKSLELVQLKNLTAFVRKNKTKKGKVPSWQGGRMSLSSPLSQHIRKKIFSEETEDSPEMSKLLPLLEKQKERSALPKENEFLIEYIRSEEGYHLLMYPFEGRAVHEGLSTLLAQRISSNIPISFSIAMNDYGFELLSDQELPIEELLESDLFSTKRIEEDIYSSINMSELARSRFREISRVSGLVFEGFPGKEKRSRHLNSSSILFFEVFKDYDPENLLFKQSFEELLFFQLDHTRMSNALERMQESKIVLTRPKQWTPLSFPIVVDRLRDRMSSESLATRIEKMNDRKLR